MGYSERVPQGFALAAAIADDSGAALARKGLASGAAEGLAKLARDLERLPAEGRRGEIKRIAASLLPPLTDRPALPERALSLIASFAPRPAGRRWLQSAPPPRHGFRPETALKDIVRRVALGELRMADDGNRQVN